MNKFCNHEWVKLTEKPYETGIDYNGYSKIFEVR